MSFTVDTIHGAATATTKQKELDAMNKQMVEIELQITTLSINEAKEARQLELDKEVVEVSQSTCTLKLLLIETYLSGLGNNQWYLARHHVYRQSFSLWQFQA